MGRPRVALTASKEGKTYVCRLNHPIRKKALRIRLADESDTRGRDTRLAKLNTIFLNPAHWHDRPADTPDDLWAAWIGDEFEAPEREYSAKEYLVELLGQDIAAEVEQEIGALYRDEIEDLKQRLKAARKEAEHWKGGKLRTGAVPLLGAAFDTWSEAYKGRDKGQTANVLGAIGRFVKEFGRDTAADTVEAGKLDSWVRGLTDDRKGRKSGKLLYPGRLIGPSRRRDVRQYVLRFLRDSGVDLDRKAVTAVSKAQLRAGRGAIRWLERSQAIAVAAALPGYWRALFRFQCATGLRPSELLTLKRGDFTPDHSLLTLSPRGKYTLKTGPRSLQIPAAVRPIIKERLRRGDVLFLKPNRQDWRGEDYFYRRYRRFLARAGKRAGVRFKIGCRIGRSTCGSQLLRAGVSVDAVAALLGDDPETIREHYAAILPHEVDPAAAALVIENQPPTGRKPTTKKPRARRG